MIYCRCQKYLQLVSTRVSFNNTAIKIKQLCFLQKIHIEILPLFSPSARPSDWVCDCAYNCEGNLLAAAVGWRWMWRFRGVEQAAGSREQGASAKEQRAARSAEPAAESEDEDEDEGPRTKDEEPRRRFNYPQSTSNQATSLKFMHVVLSCSDICIGN